MPKPKKQKRQEALARRKKDLKHWEHHVIGDEKKANIAKRDIANLERKLD